MAISIVDTAISGTSIDGTDVTLDLTTITGLAQNDVVFVCCGVPRVGVGAGTSSSGWTSVSGPTENTNIRGQVFRKVMGATPDTSFVATGTANAIDGNIALAIALRGVDTTTPEDAASTSVAGTVSTNPDAVTITTATNGAWVLDFAISGVNDTAITAPSGYSNKLSNTIVDGRPISGAVATILKATAGAEDPPSYTTWLSGRWAAFTVAVRPAGASDQTITGGLFTNTNTFFDNVLILDQAITGALFTNVNTFFNNSLALNIEGGRFNNVNTFFVNVLEFNIDGVRFDNVNQFFNNELTISAGPQDITGGLFVNPNTFFTGAVVAGDVNITGSLFTNVNQFFNNELLGIATIDGSRFNNINQFFTSAVVAGSVNINGSRFDNVNTFFNNTLINSQLIEGGLFQNVSHFFNSTVENEDEEPGGPGGPGIENDWVLRWRRRGRR